MSDFKVHSESADIEKIEGLLKEGFYIYNSMLVMELDLLKYKNEEISNMKLTDSEKIVPYDSADLTLYLKANEKGFGKQDPKEDIEEELTYKNSKIYVLLVKGKIASSVTRWDYDFETVATENIFTVPKFRNNHYASKILHYVIMDAVANGLKKARLTVYGDDTEAISMYHKFGFKVTKVLQELRPVNG